MDAMTQAVLQFPAKFAENVVAMQIRSLEEAEEYLKELQLPPVLLSFWLAGLRACRQTVQTPAVFLGHQEHFRH